MNHSLEKTGQNLHHPVISNSSILPEKYNFSELEIQDLVAFFKILIKIDKRISESSRSTPNKHYNESNNNSQSIN